MSNKSPIFLNNGFTFELKTNLVVNGLKFVCDKNVSFKYLTII